MHHDTPSARAASMIAQTIEARGITRRRLAGRLGLAESAISRRLHGQIAFSIDELGEVAEWLELDGPALTTAIFGKPRPRTAADN